MGQIKPPERAMLICGIIAASRELLPPVRDRLRSLFGAIDLESDIWPFDFTAYYQAEMGVGLLRQFVSFLPLVDPGTVAKAKLMTDSLEHEFRAGAGGQPCRRVNLDPGYVTPAKLVLATTKDFAHRIYLADGIYAETTLNFKAKRVVTFPWTYPDYASGLYTPFLLAVRRRAMDLLGAH